MAGAVTGSPGVRLPVSGERHRLEPSARGATIVRLADGAVVGRLVFGLLGDATLAIQSITVEENHRGYGAGSEAIRLLLAAVRGVDRIVTCAPGDAGLPVYFWSRMGFHPLFGAAEGGGIRFERSLAA